jgi:uncharacterized membrane protein YeaQ/YmgE (transglycosylase-associated protein family)
MSIVDFILLLIVAGLCGSIGSRLAAHRSSGWLGSIALGFIGAWLGAWLARALHLPEGYSIHLGRRAFPILWSIAGAALFTGVLSFLTRPRYF